MVLVDLSLHGVYSYLLLDRKIRSALQQVDYRLYGYDIIVICVHH